MVYNILKYIICKLEVKLTGIGKELGVIVIVWRLDISFVVVEEIVLIILDKFSRLDGLMIWMTFFGEILFFFMMMRLVEIEDEDEGDIIFEVILGVFFFVFI